MTLEFTLTTRTIKPSDTSTKIIDENSQDCCCGSLSLFELVLIQLVPLIEKSNLNSNFGKTKRVSQDGDQYQRQRRAV